MTGMEPLDLDAVRQHLANAKAAIARARDYDPTSYLVTAVDDIEPLMAEVERLTAALTEAQGALLLMRPVVEYVSMGRRHMTPATYPDGAARRALGALDDAFAASPQVREWLANTKPPVGPGKPDDVAELQRQMDELIPITVAGMRADIAELVGRLEEASAVIVLAGQQVSLDSRAWITLDGYDGSGDACRELEAKGYTRSGNGGWHPPKDGA